MKAHTLILIDIGLEFQDALNQLKKAAIKNKVKLNKILVCQALGTKHKKISYKSIEELEEFSGVKSPYCMIIPSKLHFLEKEVLEENT
jgi:diphthamide biosynthesis methyltransferase